MSHLQQRFAKVEQRVDLLQTQRRVRRKRRTVRLLLQQLIVPIQRRNQRGEASPPLRVRKAAKIVARNDGGVDGVHERYSEPLGEHVVLDESLRREERREALTAALHDLLATQLQEASWGAGERLRDFLGFAAPELEDEEWFVRDFPREAELRHAVAVYRWLRGH